MDASPRGSVGSLSEEELLAKVFPLLATSRTDRIGPGDDAAVIDLDGPLVATTDAMVRILDWRDEWSSPEDVAGKVVIANLADVAAMGARPLSLLITLIMDPQTSVDWVLRFAGAVGADCRRYDVTAAGGDLSGAAPGQLVVSITALGTLDGLAPVTRAGARPGDVLAVSGPLGRSGVGLAMLLAAEAAGTDPASLPAEALAHHRRPSCPLSQGPAAARAGASAMIDVSDGLSRDTHRIAASSGVAIDLDSTLLAPDLDWAERWVTRPVARDCVLNGGEEHSLLACFPGDRELPPWWRPIGTVTQGSGVTLDRLPLARGGWDHFSG